MADQSVESCPIRTPEKSTKVESVSIPPGCPMHKPAEEKKTIPPGCPMHKSSELNETNMMPNLAQTKQPDQTVDLPTERVISSIPKSKESDAKWEYPSPQQFYNALRRKGWETPEEHIETMVDIHNFLNEEAWNEVLKWESKYKWYSSPPFLYEKKKKKSTDSFFSFDSECAEDPYLSKFQGRPQEPTPKARLFSLFG